MSIDPDAQAMLAVETDTLAKVVKSLQDQLSVGRDRFTSESLRSRELTAELVAANRAEDKAMLASDEAVSHGIKDQKLEEIGSLKKVINRPYFARLVVEEEINGQTREFEYKIGFAANTDCRIIDWRKAPISKLYYEYKEGDEYAEEIQGKERSGIVTLRNTIDIANQKIKKVTCRYGVFIRDDHEWRAAGSSNRSDKSAGMLPNILALITPQQFRAITEDARTPILIQGIAGSGKTTVALHRLAWLLHEHNSSLQPEQSVVIVLSQALKRYISGTLPSIDINGVDVLSFSEWAARSLAQHCPHLLNSDRQLNRPNNYIPSSLDRVKRSHAMLLAVEQTCQRHLEKGSKPSPEEIVLEALSNSKAFLALDDTKLLDGALIQQALVRSKNNFDGQMVDSSDDALLIRVSQMLHGGVTLKNGRIGNYGHIVCDEVQDMNSAEISCILRAVSSSSDLTLVGDTSQQLNTNSSFPGWERLRKSCSDKESIPQYLSLAVSHRSSLPIMKLADFVQQRELVTQGREGRTPIWFRCKNEEAGIKATIDWLNKALERYPSALTAVICATPAEAKVAFDMLRRNFGSAIRLGNEQDFSFEEGIVVTDAAQVKGLEFTNVALWNPSSQSYPSTDLGRNLLYIAISRAEENLSLVTWSSSSPCLPRFGSKLLRNYDLTIEEDEAEQEPGLDARA